VQNYSGVKGHTGKGISEVMTFVWWQNAWLEKFFHDEFHGHIAIILQVRYIGSKFFCNGPYQATKMRFFDKQIHEKKRNYRAFSQAHSSKSPRFCESVDRILPSRGKEPYEKESAYIEIRSNQVLTIA